MSTSAISGKLGVFDSGLGGLLIARAVRDELPDLDMFYMGDTLHLPYGNRSDHAIYEYTRQCMDFMFEQGCQLIVMACNTASAAALQRLQQTYLANAWPGRNIIGVVVPTLEVAIECGYKKLGLIGTNYIIKSNIFAEELTKLSPDIEIIQKATPLLVPLIENDGGQWTKSVLEHYLAGMQEQGMECLILGCTHYPALKSQIRDVLGDDFPLISQDEIIPKKLIQYLNNNQEYADNINKNRKIEFFVSDLTDNYKQAALRIYGEHINITQTEFHG